MKTEHGVETGGAGEVAVDGVEGSAMEAWLEHGLNGNGSLRPEQELIVEHRLMRAVVAAMREEALALLEGQPLRADFWAGVVDFIGNFVHRVHRVKEEQIFFPLLIERELIDARGERFLHEEHEQLRDLTLAICDGVSDGDWEKVLRIVSFYLDLITPHLDSEERQLESPTVRALPDALVSRVRRDFDGLEREALDSTGRAHYLGLVRSLCESVGISPYIE